MKRIAFILMTFLLFGCSTANNNLRRLDFYLDSSSKSDDGINISFTNFGSYKNYGADTYQINFTLNLTNTNPQAYKYEITNPKFIRESNGAEYSISNIVFMNTITVNLECDIKQTVNFSGTFPTSPEFEKYYFTYSCENKTIKYHLYEMPDELRTGVEVKYVVDGEKVYSTKIPEGKSFINYCWVSSDYVYGCGEWYLDNAYQTKISEDYKVSEPLTVYGQKQSVLKYNLPEGIGSSFVSGYNFIPSSGEIVVPRDFEFQSVYSILAGAFYGECKGLKSIYIPRAVRISSYNFNLCTDLEYVYYEGSSSEWSTKNEATYPSKTQIVFNTYK